MRHPLAAGLLCLCLALPLGVAPAAGQDFSPVVIVNGAAVTAYEVDQRLRFMQVLNAPGDAAVAERDLVDDRLKVAEARRMGLTVSDEALQAGMAEFAARANMDPESFIAELGRTGVARETFRDFVVAGLLWRDILRERVAPAIRLSEAEVDQAMKRAIETPRVTEVLISELIMPAPPGSEEEVLARAEGLARSVASEADFAAAARRYSATPSAGSGGRLPWTRVENLPQGLAPILLRLRPGQVTPPLTIPGAVVLFYLRDTRGVLRPGAKDEVLEYARLTLASAADAARMQARSESCDMLQVAARGLAVERQTAAPGALPADIAMRLASLDPNESVIVDRGGAADLLMLCKRTPALLAAAPAPAPDVPDAPVAAAEDEAEALPAEEPLPDRAQVRDAIFNRKVDAASEALLAELRANAIIRRP